MVTSALTVAELRQAERYCRRCTAASGSSFTASFLLLPSDQRRAMTALYAFCRLVDDLVDETGDLVQARAQLDAWRSEIDALYAGTPRHPVTVALAPAVARHALPQALFHDIIDGMAMDLDPQPYADFAALRRYCYRVASAVGLLAAEIFGYRNERTRAYAHDLGIALQLINIARDVGEDARRGRIYLPRDEMARFGVGVADLLAGRDDERFQALMAFQIGRARQQLTEALAQLPVEDRAAQRPGLIMAATYGALLDEIVRQRVPVLQRRVRLAKAHKLWLVVKTWLAASQ